MKRLNILVLLLLSPSGLYPATQPTDDYTITMQSTWKDLEQDPQQSKKFGGKWILAGTITFKKKAKDTIHLNRLYLQWEGPRKIENLVASLYTSESEAEFLPIQENLVCDGIWNKCRQTLIFNFDEAESLGWRNNFYLVLTVQDQLEPLLKMGKFSLVSTMLPEPFQECVSDAQLCFDYNPQKPSFKDDVRVAKR